MLTQARLKEVLRYNPETGEFFWRVQYGRALVGKRAGWLHWKGYWTIHVDGKTYWAHRAAWLYMYGDFPKGQLDHINRDCADNRLVNLRKANGRQNRANSKTPPSRSGLKGAHWDKQKWSSSIKYDGNQIWLGYFDTAEEAHTVYCEAAKKLHGEFFYSGTQK